MLIAVSDLPGTGESALADMIGRALGAVVLSVDPIEAALKDVERRRDEWVPWTIDHLVVDAVAPLDDNVAKALAHVAESADNKTPKGTSLP